MAPVVSRLEVLSPLSGVLVPLETVPDPVFAQKMAGDGISIDPTSCEILAPVAGVVTQLHEAHHALAIMCGGVVILIHIGIDTVLLRGQGFTPMVNKGDTVRAGQPLLSFDADFVAGKAKSLLTQIVVANGESVRSMTTATGLVRAGQDVILTLELADAPQAGAGPSQTSGEAVLSAPVNLPNPSGMHARPAAVLAAKAKTYSATLRLQRGTDEVNAKSMLAIMGLSLRKGEAVRIKAMGSDAVVAAAALAELLAEGCGEKAVEAPAVETAPASAPAATPRDAKEFAGVPASPGLAVGRVQQYRPGDIEVQEQGTGQAEELILLQAALSMARQQVDIARRQATDDSKVQILGAHFELLDDPELTGLAAAGLEGGKSAAYAWREAFTHYAAQLEALNNPLLRERAGDIRDVGRRVLVLLAGAGATKARVVTQAETILIAEELSPSDTAALDRTKVLGFCATTGGATSHAAILARSLGIPAIFGMDEAALALADGTLVLLDGDRGILRRDPDEEELAKAKQHRAEHAAQREQELAAAGKPAVTTDGHTIEVAANIRNAQEARDAVAGGGDGVGLLRSEFLFDKRDSAPDEEEQYKAYAAVAEALGPQRRMIIRTLDVGGDKPLSYLPMPREDNPFLGVRGIRLCLEQPELFRTQLRAILRTAPGSNLHIMFPMIASLDELRAAKGHLAEEAVALGLSAKLGIMIEVPSAALLADVLAPEVDFFSIGSNDLTQYTLAMDRGHPKLAKQADAVHPAVLRLMAMTAEAAHRHGKWVGICGGVASDVLAVPLLLGLGMDELSVSVPSISAVKAAVGRASLAECRSLAAEVLKMSTAAEVRARLAALAQ